jgi:hypothetical protein
MYIVTVCYRHALLLLCTKVCVYSHDVPGVVGVRYIFVDVYVYVQYYDCDIFKILYEINLCPNKKI